MILNTLVASTKERVDQKKNRRSYSSLRREAEALPKDSTFQFEKALAGTELSFICEVKKASPSKGLIDPKFSHLKIAKEYVAAGATAISVLTEPIYFKGHDIHLQEIANTVAIPVIRKDFILDPYQIYEAKVLGAAAILLIGTILDLSQMKEYLAICHELGLSALVEAHDETEVEQALKAESRLIGVNNRDLTTFQVDLQTCIRLRNLVPESIPFIAESGIKTAADIELLRAARVNGVLIGEILMRSHNKLATLHQLRGLTP